MMNVKTMKVRIILLFCWMLNVAISVVAQIEFHVAPSVYVDGKGTLESPFNSIEATKQKVAKVKKTRLKTLSAICMVVFTACQVLSVLKKMTWALTATRSFHQRCRNSGTIYSDYFSQRICSDRVVYG